jgi:hypothetical protein
MFSTGEPINCKPVATLLDVYGWRHRLYNNKDTKAFVSVPLREGQQADSMAFSVSFFRPTFVCCFLVVVIFGKIPKFLAVKISIQSKLSSKHFYHVVMGNNK